MFYATQSALIDQRLLETYLGLEVADHGIVYKACLQCAREKLLDHLFGLPCAWHLTSLRR